MSGKSGIWNWIREFTPSMIGILIFAVGIHMISLMPFGSVEWAWSPAIILFGIWYLYEADQSARRNKIKFTP